MPNIQARVQQLVQASAEAYGCSSEIEFLQNVPALTNDKKWVDASIPSLEAVVGKENIFSPTPTLGYDDMSEFVLKYGGLYIGLGVQDSQFTNGALEPIPGGHGLVPNHHPKFYADDETLLTGVHLHTRVTLDRLSTK